MERLTPPAEPETVGVSSPGADHPVEPRALTRTVRIVDVASDSLSSFASEQELASARQQPARSRSAVEVIPGRLWWRVLAATLAAIVLVQLGLAVAWWNAAGRPWPLRWPSQTAAVNVISEPAGAAVTVDGVAHGNTPLVLQLAPGAHEVVVASGEVTWTRSVDVRAGSETSIHIVQPPPPQPRAEATTTGGVAITTEPPGLPVAVDGTPRGVSPVSIDGLSPGPHEVAVRRGTSIVRRQVSIEPGAPTAVLISTASDGIASGWLTITGPVPVQIAEGGVLLGSSDTPRLLLPVGRHDLELFNDTFGYRVRRTVQVAAGRPVAIALEPVSGTLSVNAQPWGEVWIDGQRIGETPIGNLSLPIGVHELTVRHPQLGERRRTVAISATTPARVGIDMRP